MLDLFIDQIFANTALSNQDEIVPEENDKQETTTDNTYTIFSNTFID